MIDTRQTVTIGRVTFIPRSRLGLLPNGKPGLILTTGIEIRHDLTPASARRLPGYVATVADERRKGRAVFARIDKRARRAEVAARSYANNPCLDPAKRKALAYAAELAF